MKKGKSFYGYQTSPSAITVLGSLSAELSYLGEENSSAPANANIVHLSHTCSAKIRLIALQMRRALAGASFWA